MDDNSRRSSRRSSDSSSDNSDSDTAATPSLMPLRQSLEVTDAEAGAMEMRRAGDRPLPSLWRGKK